MIWGPFLLALALGLIVSAGLYFAYLWPSVEPLDEEPALTAAPAGPARAAAATSAEPAEPAEPAAAPPTVPPATTKTEPAAST